MKFVQLILWPRGAYTDDAYATKLESRSHIRIHFMNHDYIGSFWQCQMSQKLRKQSSELKCASIVGGERTSKYLFASEKSRYNNKTMAKT